MQLRRAAVLMIALASIGFGLYAEQVQHDAGKPATYLVSSTITGLALVGAGLAILAWRLQPSCGMLLLGASVAWWFGELARSSNLVVAELAFAFGRWADVLVVWAVMAYPAGRLPSSASRWLLVAVASVHLVRSAARLLLKVPPDPAGFGTRNRYLPITDNRWFEAFESAFRWVFPMLLVLVVIVFAVRWLRAGSVSRRVIVTPLLAMIALTVAATVEHVRGPAAPVGVLGLSTFHVRFWAMSAVAIALAAGLARLRRARSALVDLVADLGRSARAFGELGSALSRALGDPGLALLPWAPAAGSFVDGRDQPVDVDRWAGSRAVTRVVVDERPVAALVHDPALSADQGLIGAVTTAVQLTAENTRLRAELELQLAELAASRARLIVAGDEERRRIERDLHDGAQQRLVTIAIGLRLAEARLPDDVQHSTRRALGDAVRELGQAIDDLRGLARGIHPTVLSEAGLGPAVQSLADRSPIPVRVIGRLATEPALERATAAYFVVSEALTNVAKHAKATRVEIEIGECDGGWWIAVSDDGNGQIDPAGPGLTGIRDRVAGVGGTLSLERSALRGSTVRARFPLDPTPIAADRRVPR